MTSQTNNNKDGGTLPRRSASYSSAADHQPVPDMSSLSYFTPAREEELLWSGNAGAATGPLPSTLGGEEARRFYQSLIEEGDGEERRGMEQRGRENRRGRRAGQHVQASRQQANTTSTTTELEGLRLLRCAQEGDLSGVRGLLSRGVDVNFQDSWWWTGVMCAAAAGQRGVVRLLLQQGAAWVGVVDTQGRDARELARMAGHSGVLEELDHYGSPQDCDHERQRGQHNHYRRETQDHQDHSSPPAVAAVQTHQNQSTQNQTQWCPVCSVHYSSPPETHLSSTLHLFSLSRPAPLPHYCLPPSTPAYQMMLRSGWTPGGGLGPEGEGHKQPVRTVLKRDSRGLGYGPTPRPKVTHFQPKDPQAVRRTGKEGRGERGRRGMKEESRREEKDRNWERDFRSSFNTFDP
ncbi:G patch domain and ankyrin repeat-containing protein 1 isoform X2 [Oncorhynchus mykiss]|uniref:G patch domain and ankyrin repeat-containing protein 1 isoform X2 n=2 Tax=Oncorhynchus mykiss TaxID=8022 RepID=UPI0018781C21|nr:G patch domain and ankyrin repeat-containing protein 1 isoform X2 [Oncorhynchus mykiss]